MSPLARWSEKRRQQEAQEDHARRLERRRYLAELRRHAEQVERDGREFTLIRIPPDYERKL